MKRMQAIQVIRGLRHCGRALRRHGCSLVLPATLLVAGCTTARIIVGSCAAKCEREAKVASYRVSQNSISEQIHQLDMMGYTSSRGDALRKLSMAMTDWLTYEAGVGKFKPDQGVLASCMAIRGCASDDKGQVPAETAAEAEKVSSASPGSLRVDEYVSLCKSRGTSLDKCMAENGFHWNGTQWIGEVTGTESPQEEGATGQ
jgi:hypothetical protein